MMLLLICLLCIIVVSTYVVMLEGVGIVRTVG